MRSTSHSGTSLASVLYLRNSTVCQQHAVRWLPYYTLDLLEVSAWQRDWNMWTVGTAVLLRTAVTPCLWVTGSKRFESSRCVSLHEEWTELVCAWRLRQSDRLPNDTASHASRLAGPATPLWERFLSCVVQRHIALCRCTTQTCTADIVKTSAVTRSGSLVTIVTNLELLPCLGARCS